jgi:hypothetical protein
MTDFGLFYYRWGEDTTRVSFYTHKNKINNKLDAETTDELSKLVDRYARMDFYEFLIGAYMWLYPDLLESFLKFSPLYLEEENYKALELKKRIKLKPPIAYQVFVTNDYCSALHADDDLSEYTLMYSSHPDYTSEANGTSVDYDLGSYGAQNSRRPKKCTNKRKYYTQLVSCFAQFY